MVSKFKTLMDIMDDEIQCSPESRRTQYGNMMINIVTQMSDLSRMIEKDVKYLDHSDIDDLD